MHIGFGAKYKESMAKHRPWEPAGEALNGLRTANIVLHFVARQLRSAAMRPLRASFRIIFARSRLISVSPTASYWPGRVPWKSGSISGVRNPANSLAIKMKTFQLSPRVESHHESIDCHLVGMNSLLNGHRGFR